MQFRFSICRNAIVLSVAFSPLVFGQSVLITAPRPAVSKLKDARRSIAEERFSDAVVEISELLRADGQNTFVLDWDRPDRRPRTLQAEVENLVHSLPADCKRQYRDWCQADANRMLNRAVANRDRKGMAHVVRSYPGTRAAHDATYMLGVMALDHGNAGEALSWWRYLDRWPAVALDFEPQLTLQKSIAWSLTGNSERAETTCDRLTSFSDDTTVQVGAKQFRLGDGTAPVFAAINGSMQRRQNDVVPNNWELFGGSASRGFVKDYPGGGGKHSWQIDTSDSTKIQNAPPDLPPVAQPLIVGDNVISRTPEKIVVFDKATGRQVWQYPGEDNKDPPPALVIEQRLYRDAAYGQISSDGQRLFFIEELSPAIGLQSNVNIALMINGRIAGEGFGPIRPYNRLTAVSIERQGSLCWSVGMASGEDEPELAGASFLGAPTSHHNELLVLAEFTGDIKLCALEVDSGRLVWSLPIAAPTQPILRDSQRRLAGASVSISEGIVVCTTSAGAVCGIDPYAQQVLWAFEYDIDSKTPQNRFQPFAVAGGWADSVAHISDSHVVLSPVGSRQLICLDLQTGDLIWKAACSSGIYIAGIHRNKAVAVASNGLHAWDLQTGRVVFDDIELPLSDETAPAGRGFFSGDHYYLPTKSKQILKVDVERMTIAGRIPTGSQLGNIVATPNQLISVSPTSIDAYSP